MEEDIIAILAIFVFIPSLIFLLAAIKIFKSGGSKKGRESNEETNRLAQQMYNDLERMEKRIEALETILIDKMKRG